MDKSKLIIFYDKLDDKKKLELFLSICEKQDQTLEEIYIKESEIILSDKLMRFQDRQISELNKEIASLREQIKYCLKDNMRMWGFVFCFSAFFLFLGTKL